MHTLWLRFFTVAVLVSRASSAVFAQAPPPTEGVDAQPLAAQVQRVAQALEMLGSRLPADQRQALDEALATEDSDAVVDAIEHTLDPLCLVEVQINPESRVKAFAGPAKAELVEQGWRVFLVKVHNEAGVTAKLRVTSPNAAAMHQ